MRWTRLIVRAQPAGPFVHWPQSDTLAGKFFWTYRELAGEEALAELLRSHREEPLIVFSTLFPDGTIPMPILSASLPRPENEDGYRLLKRIKTLRYIKAELLVEFVLALRSSSTEKHFGRLRAFVERTERDTIPISSYSRLSNVISRTEHTVLEGQLFSLPETRLGSRVWFFVGFDADRLDEALLRETIRTMLIEGVGKRKSVGYGAFEIESITFSEDNISNAHQAPSAFMNLSVWVPAATDPTEGTYSILTKFARLGGDFSIRGYVAKKPFLYLAEGSVFRVSKGQKRPYFGTILDNVQVGFDTPVIQNTLSFPFYFAEEGAPA